MHGKQMFPVKVPTIPFDPTLDMGAVIGTTALRLHKEAKRLRMQKSEFLFEHPLVVQPNDETVIPAIRVYAGLCNSGFDVQGAALVSKGRCHIKCENHPSGEVIDILVKGHDRARRPAEGLVSICATCGASINVDQEIQKDLFRLMASVPCPESSAAKAESPPKKSRARGSTSTHRASLSAG